MLLPTYLTTDRSEDSYVWRDICIIRVVSAKGPSHICAEVENEEHAPNDDPNAGHISKE